jgi:hypothetical protein
MYLDGKGTDVSGESAISIFSVTDYAARQETVWCAEWTNMIWEWERTNEIGGRNISETMILKYETLRHYTAKDSNLWSHFVRSHISINSCPTLTKVRYRILVGKPEGKRSLGRLRCRRVGNIKTDFRDMRFGVVWTGLIWLRIGTSGGLLWTR